MQNYIFFEKLTNLPDNLIKLEKILLQINTQFKPSLSDIQGSLLNYAKKLLKNACVVVAADVAGRFIGLIAIYINDHEFYTAFISLIMVSSEYKNRGYGRAIISYAEGLAFKAGMLKIKLEVRNSNYNAIKFYYAMEYIKVGETDDAMFLEKKLYPR